MVDAKRFMSGVVTSCDQMWDFHLSAGLMCLHQGQSVVTNEIASTKWPPSSTRSDICLHGYIS